MSTWKVEIVDVFRSIVDSQRKNLQRLLVYKPSLSKAMTEFFCLLYTTRSKFLLIDLGIINTKDKSGKVITFRKTKAGWQRYKPRDFEYIHSNDKDDDKNNNNDDTRNSSHTPLPSYAKLSHNILTNRNANSNQKKGVIVNSDHTKKQITLYQLGNIDKKEYYTQGCLFRLITGGSFDISFLNIANHGKKHLKKSLLLGMMPTQLKE